MDMMNSVLLEGYIVRSEEKETAEGFFLLSLIVASTREHRNVAGEKTSEISFFDCEARGDFGKNIAAKCTAGRYVRIVGWLKQSRWGDGVGKLCPKVFVVAELVEFRDSAEKPGKEGLHANEPF